MDQGELVLQGGAEDLWVSVDDFANEIIRWFLDCADGHTIVITRDGVPFAYMVPVATWDARRSGASAHAGAETDVSSVTSELGKADHAQEETTE